MAIKIIFPTNTGGKPSTAQGTQVFNDTGTAITDICHMNIDLEPNNVIIATVDIYVQSIENMENIHALLGTETLQEIADLHGYELVKIDGA